MKKCPSLFLEGVKLRYLNREYEEFHDEKINPQEFGYPSLKDFLMTCRDACRLKRDPADLSEFIVVGVADQSTAHIQELVNKAAKKKGKKKKKAGGPRFTDRAYYRTGQAPGRTVNRYGPQLAVTVNFRGSHTNRPQPAARLHSAPAARMSSAPAARFSAPAARMSSAVAAKSFEERKKPKTTTSPPHVYAGYVGSILKNRPKGIYAKALECQYETKFRESLPVDWIRQLENLCLEVVQDYGDGIVLIKEMVEKPVRQSAAAPVALKGSEDSSSDDTSDDEELSAAAPVALKGSENSSSDDTSDDEELSDKSVYLDAEEEGKNEACICDRPTTAILCTGMYKIIQLIRIRLEIYVLFSIFFFTS